MSLGSCNCSDGRRRSSLLLAGLSLAVPETVSRQPPVVLSAGIVAVMRTAPLQQNDTNHSGQGDKDDDSTFFQLVQASVSLADETIDSAAMTMRQPMMPAHQQDMVAVQPSSSWNREKRESLSSFLDAVGAWWSLQRHTPSLCPPGDSHPTFSNQK